MAPSEPRFDQRQWRDDGPGGNGSAASSRESQDQDAYYRQGEGG
eukprot:CAMPEP_0113578386 /NCGR_PEP_ID=MMETSP0015_2-20120614/29456_1 /TAXON_ID=2838 /ORGANISM="Odontella" /LENGTH=43 /DNA_ID=CAMNT_0000482193 /DNA_START=49 /DNA_END=176 /DNA_ORIENTATION=+ /assembly_acc=CAM_ASM_000160